MFFRSERKEIWARKPKILRLKSVEAPGPNGTYIYSTGIVTRHNIDIFIIIYTLYQYFRISSYNVHTGYPNCSRGLGDFKKLISLFNLLKVNINHIDKLTENVSAFFLNSNSIR